MLTRRLFLSCLACIAASVLLGLAPATVLAGGRIPGMHGEGLSQAQVSAAGAQPMTKAEVQAFIDSHNGNLQGNIGPWHDSLKLYSDKTIRGESRGSFGATAATGSGSWSIDEDGTFHISVIWSFGDKQQSSGKLYAYQGYLYQMDSNDPARSWLYRIRQ